MSSTMGLVSGVFYFNETIVTSFLRLVPALTVSDKQISWNSSRSSHK